MMRGMFPPTLPNLPVIELAVGWENAVKTLPFVLDTGFSGDLQLNKKTFDELGLKSYGVQRATIANGQVIEQPVATAIAAMEDVQLLVTLSVSEGAALAGIGLFTKFGYKIMVDCRYRTVELERVS